MSTLFDTVNTWIKDTGTLFFECLPREVSYFVKDSKKSLYCEKSMSSQFSNCDSFSSASSSKSQILLSLAVQLINRRSTLRFHNVAQLALSHADHAFRAKIIHTRGPRSRTHSLKFFILHSNTMSGLLLEGIFYFSSASWGRFSIRVFSVYLWRWILADTINCSICFGDLHFDYSTNLFMAKAFRFWPFQALSEVFFET